ncbi:bcl-2-binding component 3 isoform X1 [Dromiciops gliroides]|uniref:bcl-2-binding component 3 isoform X1 n=2 Tax=Dromiciops gliroides TaxID=33562 RepID=UPI001CC7037A|nr:bcl-2-binding component 3 isoform X1 [Dromiciops gliroides]
MAVGGACDWVCCFFRVSFSASALAPMARAQQDGSSPEPVEGLPRESPRTFPLGRLMPSAVSCSLCEAGLNPSADSMCPAPGPALAPPSLLPLAYFCTRQPRAYGGPRWARVARSPVPGSQGQSGSQPSLGERSAEEEEDGGQEREPQVASPMSGGPPGVLGPEHGDQGEQQDREIGAQLRRMADDLNALYEQRRREEEQRRHLSPWRLLYNLISGLLAPHRGNGIPEIEPN